MKMLWRIVVCISFNVMAILARHYCNAKEWSNSACFDNMGHLQHLRKDCDDSFGESGILVGISGFDQTWHRRGYVGHLN